MGKSSDRDFNPVPDWIFNKFLRRKSKDGNTDTIEQRLAQRKREIDDEAVARQLKKLDK